MGLLPVLEKQCPFDRVASEPEVVVPNRALREQRLPRRESDFLILAPILKQCEQTMKYRSGETGAGLVRNFQTLARERQSFGLSAIDKGDLSTVRKDHGLVTTRLQSTGLR